MLFVVVHCSKMFISASSTDDHVCEENGAWFCEISNYGVLPRFASGEMNSPEIF